MLQWPSSLGNVIVLEAKYITQTIKRMLPSNPILLNALSRAIGQQLQRAQNTPEPSEPFDIIKFLDEVDINVCHSHLQIAAVLTNVDDSIALA
jgi:hypothetical protein